ncbi:integral membrane [Pyrenophora seminiperda CCB06]|uniref:Integral membrane n=1 Tax=Pyrenophora seminiperda CCB06 TaxID=1302712 RepID=A0A3M7LZD3_9PLEO|nr:integral membrane [Pyrenophora seminiperda CCB06]
MLLIPVIALTVLYPLTSVQVFDRHIWDINYLKDADLVVLARKELLVIECLFCIASGLIKISILLFYRRLSARAVSKAFVYTTWICIGFIIAYSIALTLAPILGCQPISAFWDQVNVLKILGGYKFKCFNEGADVLAASILSAAQDFITAILPTFLYWNLRIPFRQKLALFGIFAIGYGVVALGLVRAYYSWQTFFNTYDITWSTWNILLTSMLELHIGCLCANAPSFKVFFKHFFQEKLSSLSKSSKSPGNSKERYDSGNSGSAHSMSTSLWSKLASKLSSNSGTQSSRGYHDSHNGISVDNHGGVYVHKKIQISHSPTSTTMERRNNNRHLSSITADIICDRDYEDIELGRYNTGRSSDTSSIRTTLLLEEMDLEALPPLPPISRATHVTTIIHDKQLCRATSSSVHDWPSNISLSRGCN